MMHFFDESDLDESYSTIVWFRRFDFESHSFVKLGTSIENIL